MQPLNDMCISKFQGMVSPGKNVCIDETIVPFSGCLLIKQYIPKKTHKYGIMVFKLCTDTVSTWNLSIYAGKKADAVASVPTNVALKLLDSLLGCGRAAVTDSCYTVVVSTKKFIGCDAYLLGILHTNK
jgi:hypothetical protein